MSFFFFIGSQTHHNGNIGTLGFFYVQMNEQDYGNKVKNGNERGGGDEEVK